ncbi:MULTISPECIES: DUF6297 family protein [unclassified Luteococcus]|uniref:DUF6297 family protein n=1 Tax=unclassified Luteococcus TaxID=2639923 RepID=UPI00313BC678
MTATIDAVEGEFAEPLRPQFEADEKQLLLLMKDWRQGRATRNLRQALSDAYIAVFTVVMIAAMVINVIISAQRVASTCGTGACLSARGLLPWAALFGSLALTLAACRLFGPVLASAAEGFWLMDAPVRRARLLANRLVLAIGLALALGAAMGALVAALTGSPGLNVLTWAGATGLGAAGLVALAAAEQGAERSWTVRTLHLAASLAGVATLLAVVATATGQASIHIGNDRTLQLTLLTAGIGLVLAIAAGLVARTRLGRIRRARLLSGGSLASGMQGAMFALDFGLMRDILVEREALQRGSVKPARGRGTGIQALVWRDAQRLVRFPKPLALLAVSVVVPYAVQALGLGSLNVAISALVLMAALIPCFGSLRVLSRTKGLARSLPWSTAEIHTATTIVPAVLTALWGLAVVPAFLGLGTEAQHDPTRSLLVSVVCAVAGLVAAVRWVSAKPADYSAPMLSTSAGAMPPGLALNLVRGFDMVALITLPVVLGFSPWISLVLAAVAFSILRMGGIDQQALLEQQEEQKRQLAEAKAERTGQKQPDKPAAKKVVAPKQPGKPSGATAVKQAGTKQGAAKQGPGQRQQPRKVVRRKR